MGYSLLDQDFTLFKDLIYKHSGIHFSNANRSILESRLKERLKIVNLESVQEYYNSILNNQGELKVLLDSVTTNLTRFFRNTGHFSAFENYTIPEIVNYKQKKHQTHIKLWCAGCSTGEEPYSLAMVLKEKLPAGLTFSITGSELSLKSLMTAQEGFYPETRINGVPDPYLDKYFDKKHDGFQIKDEIKKHIKFDYHNLMFDSGLKDIDILFCRNVLIYFDSQAQKSVVERFYRVMTAYSFLYIGHSESLFGMDTKFQFVKTEWATLYSKFLE